MSDTSNTMGEQVLGALGLDTICVQVYLVMHSAPEADTAQIAESLGLQTAEVIDAIDALSDLTLLRPGLSPAQKLRPVSIERAIHTLIRQQSEQLKIQSGSLAMLQSAMKELLESRPTSQDGFGHADIETLSGAEQVQSLIERLMFRAKESVMVRDHRTANARGAPRGRETLRRGGVSARGGGSQPLSEFRAGRPSQYGVRAMAQRPRQRDPIRPGRTKPDGRHRPIARCGPP